MRVSVLVLLVLCEAASDRAAPTPATRIWYNPYSRVGEPCGRGAQSPSNGGARKGKRARNMSRNRSSEGFHLEGINNVPQFWEGQVKEDAKVCEKRAEAVGRRGASRSDQRRLTASSGTSLDLVSLVLLWDNFWSTAVQTLLVILLQCAYLTGWFLPGSSYALVNRRLCRSLDAGRGRRLSAACPVYFFFLSFPPSGQRCAVGVQCACLTSLCSC